MASPKGSRARPPQASGLRATGTAAEPLSVGAPGDSTWWSRVDTRTDATVGGKGCLIFLYSYCTYIFHVVYYKSYRRHMETSLWRKSHSILTMLNFWRPPKP